MSKGKFTTAYFSLGSDSDPVGLLHPDPQPCFKEQSSTYTLLCTCLLSYILVILAHLKPFPIPAQSLYPSPPARGVHGPGAPETKIGPPLEFGFEPNLESREFQSPSDA